MSWRRGTAVGIATLVVLTAVKLAFTESIGRPTPFLLYFGAALIAAWYGGLVAGVVTTAISAVLGYVFFIADAPGLGWGRVATQLAVFAIEGLAISWLTGRLARERRAAVLSARAARDASGQLEGALRELDVGITLQDTEGTIVYANAAAARIVGLARPEDLLAVDQSERMKLFDVLDENGASVPVERLPTRAVLLGRAPAEMLVQFKTADRRDVRWMVVDASAVHGDEGELRFVVTAFRDVTEQRAQEEALRVSREWIEHARAEAVLANRTKDDFLAMLGHELRNPLAPILTALELMKLRKGQNSEREREIIERQVRYVVRLVDDLLDVSRITRGRIELTKAPVELADVVTRGVEIVAPLVEERRHSLAIDVARGLVVDGDAVRLGQVVANLLANAAKYTEPNGAIRITAEREGEGEGERVLLRVSDSGIGIAPEMLSRIFDGFVQEPQAIDRAQGGLGLGLTIVQSLVHVHGGSVEARSDGPGKGSEFVVKLPVASGQAATATEAEPAAESIAADNRMRVLVVDDNVDALEMLVEVLTMLGHEAHHAVDGPSALALATDVQPTVALLDLGLPLIDGYQLAKRLRELPGLASIKLVAVTGYGQASDRERTAAAGFDAHLVKPIGIDAIRSVIDTVCR